MRHLKKGKKINTNTSRRKALFKSLLISLFKYDEVKTTFVKAKMIKSVADSLVSKAKKGSLSVRRQLMAFLSDKKAANKLVDEIAPRFKDISGGFTKLVRLGTRRGDNAPMAKIELIRKQENKKTIKQENKKVLKNKK